MVCQVKILPNPCLPAHFGSQRPEPGIEQCSAGPQESGTLDDRVVKDALLQVVPQALPPGPRARWGGTNGLGPDAQQPLEGDHQHNQQLACKGVQ